MIIHCKIPICNTEKKGESKEMKKWYVMETGEDIERNQLEEELNRLEEEGFNIQTVCKMAFGMFCIVSYKEEKK